MRYLWTCLIVVLSKFEGLSLFTKFEIAPIHRLNEIRDTSFTRRKVSLKVACFLKRRDIGSVWKQNSTSYGLLYLLSRYAHLFCISILFCLPESCLIFFLIW